MPSRLSLPIVAIVVAATTAVAQVAGTDPAAVFKAYETAVNAGDSAAIAAMIATDPAPTPFTFCPPTLNDRDCLIDYLNKTVVTTHSVITPIAITVNGDTVEAKLEVRNDLIRAVGVERLAGTDRIKVADGKIVAFAFLRDEADPQTQRFFAYMMKTLRRGDPPNGPGVITQACDGRVQAPTVLRMAPNGLAPLRRAVSTTVRMAASPSAAHMAR